MNRHVSGSASRRAGRRSLQPSVLATGALAAAVATTGGVVTVVGWTAGSEPETFTVHAAEIPRIGAPKARPHARPRISWTSVRLAGDVPVQRYVVTRHLGGVAQVACDVPATARPRCIDEYAPAGYRATYTVVARHGAHWVGADSEPSPAVTTPGVAVPISVDGVLIVPGTDGEPVVAGAAPEAAAPSAAPSEAVAAPSGEPSVPPGETAPPPVVHVPPAPPVLGGTPDPVVPPPDEAPEEPSAEPVTESTAVPKEPDAAATAG